MLNYRVRPRVIHFTGEKKPVLPGICEVCFHFRPLQVLGVEAGGGRTLVRGVPAAVTFDSNSRAITMESVTPLRPLDVTRPTDEGTIHLSGSTLVVTKRFETLNALDEFIFSVTVAMPPLLNVDFADPPYVWRVEGAIGGVSFGWELKKWTVTTRPTTQEEQEAAVAAALGRMALVAASERRRLLAGLHYFHLACRLARKGDTVGEFMAEVILNLAKTLEVLFPPVDGQSRDAARVGLARLGFSEDEIEGNFIPALALRSKIDVAHVELGLFSVAQLQIIHAFTERAEEAFREMLKRLLNAIETGAFDISPYELGAAGRDAATTIERLERFTPKPPEG